MKILFFIFIAIVGLVILFVLYLVLRLLVLLSLGKLRFRRWVKKEIPWLEITASLSKEFSVQEKEGWYEFSDVMIKSVKTCYCEIDFMCTRLSYSYQSGYRFRKKEWPGEILVTIKSPEFEGPRILKRVEKVPNRLLCSSRDVEIPLTEHEQQQVETLLATVDKIIQSG